ncbi:hypothetical protein [Nostoc sp. UHCC 0252]|uniref:hypothetical protein n=1 Tax=Nostoc sp. UHCC 0252 TaxID=3110241 RepID=UPI002B1F8F9E|nr:hypothetical protein [Nostoc sp. UHCC 0252]MEA5605050.1 hypothetical protein [Nostoc sp. UHCC 0252]
MNDGFEGFLSKYFGFIRLMEPTDILMEGNETAFKFGRVSVIFRTVGDCDRL